MYHHIKEINALFYFFHALFYFFQFSFMVQPVKIVCKILPKSETLSIYCFSFGLDGFLFTKKTLTKFHKIKCSFNKVIDI